jgi:hypothetical protein
VVYYTMAMITYIDIFWVVGWIAVKEAEGKVLAGELG